MTIWTQESKIFLSVICVDTVDMINIQRQLFVVPHRKLAAFFAMFFTT